MIGQHAIAHDLELAKTRLASLLLGEDPAGEGGGAVPARKRGSRLCWFAATAIEALGHSIARVELLIDQTRLLDRLRGHLNDRQEKALLRMLREGPEGFQGGLSASNYASITGASPATTTRDLADMVAKGALIRVGEHRHARYHISIP